MTAAEGNRGLPEEAYAAALASVPQMGPATLRALLANDTPSAAWWQGSFAGDVARIWQAHEESAGGSDGAGT